jgi:CRISPR system Cascade subunit CasE
MHLTQLKLPKAAHAAATISRFLSSRYAEHQIVWELSGAPPEAKREFLFRSDMRPDGLEVLVLSRQPLTAITAPWESQTRLYAPELETGQLLRFKLRMSPTVDRAQAGKRSVRTDLVMELVHSQLRHQSVAIAAQAAAEQWLRSRAHASGFRLVECIADNYQRLVMVDKGKRITTPSLDVEGLLEITDPTLFLEKQRTGYGKAKFAGMGLMLVRRP